VLDAQITIKRHVIVKVDASTKIADHADLWVYFAISRWHWFSLPQARAATYSTLEVANMLMTANLADAKGGDCDRCDADNRSAAPYELPDGTRLCFPHLGQRWKQAKDPLSRARLRSLYFVRNHIG
jgi:hypothetical protein